MTKLVKVIPGPVPVEVWDVTLSSGANVGSAVFRVTIKKADSANQGQEIAKISIKYLYGN